MSRAQWERLPRRKQLIVIRHMAVATVAAMALSNIQVERMISGYFDALNCIKPRSKKCGACAAGWTKASR